eukprot:ctg_17.g1
MGRGWKAVQNGQRDPQRVEYGIPVAVVYPLALRILTLHQAPHHALLPLPPLARIGALHQRLRLGTTAHRTPLAGVRPIKAACVLTAFLKQLPPTLDLPAPRSACRTVSGNDSASSRPRAARCSGAGGATCDTGAARGARTLRDPATWPPAAAAAGPICWCPTPAPPGHHHGVATPTAPTAAAGADTDRARPPYTAASASTASAPPHPLRAAGCPCPSRSPPSACGENAAALVPSSPSGSGHTAAPVWGHAGAVAPASPPACRDAPA